MDQPLEQLRAGLAGRYRLEDRLGAGGMAIVYHALDVRHDRKVAVKVVRPALAAAMGRDRFLREIETAARLQHPHIVPVYESGDVDGVLYYVMPFVEGESLRARLTRERQLPVEDVLKITHQVAEALGYAHARGIVHRDIKPENILLSGNTAVVADFGIARAVAEAGGDRLTETGLSLGTPSYMSPEQVAADPGLDTRSDIYSLGCVVHEMLVGEPPFTGPSAQAVMARQSLEAVRSLRVVRPTIPRPVEAAVLKALAKTPADRWATAIQFADALEEAARPEAQSVAQPRPRFRPAVIIGVLALVLAAVAVALLRPWAPGGEGEPRTPMIVVLAFRSIGAPEEKPFADGLTEEITSRLAGIAGLGVIARSSAAAYDSGAHTPTQIAKDLGADYVLTGSIQMERTPDGKGSVRVIPHLADVNGGREVWTDRYDANLAPGEILHVQGDLALAVAEALDVRLTAADTGRIEVRPTTNLAAYDAYVRGNLYASQYFPEDPLRTAVSLYEQAVTLDSGFALAYAKLGQAQSIYSFYYDRSPARRARARAAVDRARALAPNLPEAELALGYYYYWAEQDYPRAMDVFRDVENKEPNNSELLWIMGSLERRLGHWDRAVELTSRGLRLDPRSQRYAYDLAALYHVLRRFPEAEQSYDRAIALAPDWIVPYLSKSLLEWSVGGDTARAREVLDEARRHVGMTTILTTLVGAFRDHLLVIGGEYQDSLDTMTLSTVPMDSGGYYLIKATTTRLRQGTEAARPLYDSARAIWQARATARPDDPTAHSYLAEALAGLGRAADAVREGERAVQLDVANGDVYRQGIWRMLLTRTYAVLGDTAHAVAEAEQLLEEPSLLTPAWFRFHPLFKPLARSPRLQHVLQ
jgi:eukaryotic-like serine/threonine-protein kinase